jgi:dihydropteroate synthase
MIADGAAVIDIGAESTRPGATPVSAQEEWQRLEPVVKALRSRLYKVRFSIDTRHFQTARKAMPYGFDWLNDVGGGRDRAMSKLAKEYGCIYVLMHSLAIPADPAQVIAAGDDPVEVVFVWAQQQLDILTRLGIRRSRIILDPGIGFGKTAEQSLALIHNIARFKTLGVPLMVGHSRKSFLLQGTDKEAPARDPETLSVSEYLVAQGVDYLRVHDVRGHAALLGI